MLVVQSVDVLELSARERFNNSLDSSPIRGKGILFEGKFFVDPLDDEFRISPHSKFFFSFAKER